jgi:LPXTG-motif cell wall-anchored protein
MKKSVLVFSMTLLLILSGLNVAIGQDQPQPKKDTVNMDTEAKPTYYYPTEDTKSGKSSTTTIALVVGGVVIVGGAAFFLLKKKSN